MPRVFLGLRLWNNRGTQRGVGREHTEVGHQVLPGRRDQGTQPLDENERGEDKGLRSVVVSMPEAVENAPIGKQLQPIREFFVDNAVRKNDALSVTSNRTEVCQYYAFFFDVATSETHPDLWKILCKSFGPDRKERNAYPGIHPANAFIGNMLRMEILSRYGRCRQILDESIDNLLYMAERTGTLWENVGAHASCNHGFASHIVHTLYRDILGIYRVDLSERVVTLRFTDARLPWCEGRIPFDEGPISMGWWESDGKIEYRIQVPAGYKVRVENLSGREVIRIP
jgi:hypothetical protein